MFGRWKPAQAKVVACEHTQNQYGPWYISMVLDVQPADEPPFRAEVKVNAQGFDRDLRNFIPPRPGDALQVEYKGQEVRVIVDPAHDLRVADQHRREEWDALAHGQPGSGPVSPGAGPQIVVTSTAGGQPFPPDMVARLEELREQGLLTEQQFEAAKAQVEATAGGGMGAPAGVDQSDVAARLQRLEQLRAQRLVSDEEYAAERRRILGSI
jgi:hypothetical protein